MRKVYKLDGELCANCAGKIQAAAAGQAGGTETGKRIWMLRCKISRPQISGSTKEANVSAQTQSVTKLFSFDTMSDAVRASHALAPAYRGESALYRDEKSGRLYLMLRMENIREFSKMRSVIAAFSEYGNPENIQHRSSHLDSHTAVFKHYLRD